ncbi:GntR family transcriptional regulator [Frigidibacter sp. MR17.14]|uniref:GntR family transcriptional regulator n=1 Tax=Frigidibacter sp. MR17.14 TaxID=3126509 RepID=UPI003012F5B1
MHSSLDRESVNAAAAVGPQLQRILRERIIRNRLRPGERISEAEIALQFGVSRQPVREAFIKLAEEGLLEVRPQRGTFVRKISVAAVMDSRFVREAIEADIVKLLAEAPDAALVRELDRQLAAQRALVDVDPQSFRPLDDEFHRTLAEGAGKTHAWSVIDGMKTQMDRVRQLSTERFPTDKLIDHHTRVVRAIEAGDPAAAEAAMRLHLREILNDLPVVQSSLPELFD